MINNNGERTPYRKKSPIPSGKIITCVTELMDFEIEELKIRTGKDNKKDALRGAVLYSLENMISEKEPILTAENEKTVV